MFVSEIAPVDGDLVAEVTNVPQFSAGRCSNENVNVGSELHESFRKMGPYEPVCTGDEDGPVGESALEIHRYTLPLSRIGMYYSVLRVEAHH